MIIKFEDGQFETEKRGLIQYDFGQSVKIVGIDDAAENVIFQFIKNGSEVDMLGTKDDEGIFTVDIPNQFLQTGGNILLYCYFETLEEGKTKRKVVFDVLEREKYEGEPPEDTKGMIALILEKLAELQDEIDHWTLTPEQLAQITEEVEAEIGNDYYTKTATDDLLANKADKSEIPDVSGFATKTELNTGLATKADKSDTYTKSEVNNLIPDISGLATKQEVTSGLATKADANNVYTKSETYSKTEIDNILGDIQTILEGI